MASGGARAARAARAARGICVRRRDGGVRGGVPEDYLYAEVAGEARVDGPHDGEQTGESGSEGRVRSA